MKKKEPQHVASDGLTNQERRFVAAYAGDNQEAALAAGYSKKNADTQGARIMARERVRKALLHRDLDIPLREKNKLDRLITDRNERLKWIVDQINAKKHGIKIRLKAMEMLQKSCGDYLEPAQPTNGRQQAPPAVIVIRPGKDSQTAITINPQDGQGDKGLVDVTGGKALPINEGVGEGLPDGDGE